MTPQITNRLGWLYWGSTVMVFCLILAVFLGWFAPGAAEWSWQVMLSLGFIALMIGILARNK